ncbi:MAG: hypothetical protein WA324_30665, partial [Bryobacteraceae bacterium]
LYPCLCSWAILRITKSLPMAVLSFVMVAIAASRVLRWEPGHPNDLCGLSLAALVFAASFLSERSTRALLFAGLICTAALLVKVNVGVYLSLGLLAGLLPFTKSVPLRRATYLIFAIAALCFPTVLMHAHLGDGWAVSLDVVITLALASAFLLATKIAVEPFAGLRSWVIAIGVSTLFGAVLLGMFIAIGSSLSAIVTGSVLQHLGTDKAWYIPVSAALSVHCAVITLFGFGLMLWVRRDPVLRARSNVVIGLKLAAWALLFALIVLNTDSIKLATGQIAFVDGPALLWLALLPSAEDPRITNRPFRYVVVFATLFMLLFPYPVGGDHADMPTISMIVIYVLCLDDGLTIIQERYRQRLLRNRWTWLAGPAFMSCLCLILIGLAGYNYRHYRSWVSLRLPGASRVHLKPEEARMYETLARKVNQDCQGFISMPGFDSLYFWTGQEPPTTINMSNWITVLAPSYQRQTIKAIENDKRDCVIENDYWVEWWRRGQDLNKILLAHYIRTNFKQYDQVGDYRILVRRDR